MSEPIYDVSLSAHLLGVEDDSLAGVELVSSRSGPAGEAVVELSDSIRVSVDYAQPELFTSISIVADGSIAADGSLDGESRGLLGDLIGEDRVDDLERVIAGGFDRAQRLPSSVIRQQISSLDPDPREQAIRLGQMASVSSIATDTGEASIVRLVAALEGVAIAGTFANDRIRRSFERRMESTVGSMIGTIDPISLPEDVEDDLRILMDNHRNVARQIEMVAGRVAASGTGIFADLAIYVESSLRRGADEPMLLSAPEFDAGSWNREPEMAPLRMMSSISNAEIPLMVDSAGMGRLELVWPDNPGGSWVRIMHPDDLTLVALVPVRRVDGQWEAEAIVPPDRPLNTWIIEVTSIPLGSGSRTAAERIVEAVRLGQAAARMQRGTLQPFAGIRVAWLACAGAWDELGDEFRANKAREYADGGRVTRRLQVADQVRTALGLDDI